MAGEKDGKKDEKSDGSIVLKLDKHCHCEGCKTRLLKAARKISGVDKVRVDWEADKLTVKTTLDPSKFREKLEKKTKKKFELISPAKKEKESNNSNAEKKPDEKKADEKKSGDDEKKSDEKKSKEPPETTAVLKLQLHCTGCIVKIYKIALKFKGVDKVNIDKEKELVTVNGIMDAKALMQRLSEKMKRPVEIVPPKKDKENSEGKEGGNGGGGKKKGGGGGDAAVEVIGGNRLEYMGFPGYPLAPAPAPAYGPDNAYPYPTEHPYGYPFFCNPYPPQCFSDENPNACPCAIM